MNKTYPARAPPVTATGRPEYQTNHQKLRKEKSERGRLVYPNGNGVSGFARLASEDVIITPCSDCKRLWNSFLLLLQSFRPWWSPSVPVSACGVSSTSWKVMAMTTPAQMLMCRKVAQTREQIATPLFCKIFHN